MTRQNTEIGKAFTGYLDLDGTHPERGNFVLRPDGAAWYGGVAYYREGYAPQSAVKPEPAPERLPLGTRVVIKRGASLSDVWVGQIGTLVERPDNVTHPYDYFAALDSDAEGAFPLALYADEVEAYTEPEPAAAPTHQHPEGLYESGRTRVIVRHEPEDETYSILYIDNALAGYPEPVNRGMTKVTELGYMLVTEFKA